MFHGIEMTTAGQVLASSGDGDIGSIGLLFFLSGFVFYGLMYVRYRNIDKRHMHARETEATMANVRAADDFQGKRTGMSNKHIKGGNERQIEGAQGTAGVANVLGSAMSNTSVGKIFTKFK